MFLARARFHIRRGAGIAADCLSPRCISSSFSSPPSSSSAPAIPGKINLHDAFAAISEPWDPHVAFDVNDAQVKLARLEGEFVWHHHADEDEVFLVVHGKMRMQYRERDDVDLAAGEMICVPRGVEHCPMALTDSCDVLLIERATTLNTGSAQDAIGDLQHEKSKAGVSLTKTELKRV